MNQLLKQYVSALSGEGKHKVKSIFLTGSKADGEGLDFYSDTDIILVLDEGEILRNEAWWSCIRQLGTVIAKEEFYSEESGTFRLILVRDEKIERLDLSILSYEAWMKKEFRASDALQLLYGEALPIKRTKAAPVFSFPSAEDLSAKSHRIWFLLFECVKKFMRKDNLIGLHLLLDILREYLVLCMIRRDVELQTNIHRMGQSESLAASIQFDKLMYQHPFALLDYVGNLATEIDQEF